MPDLRAADLTDGIAHAGMAWTIHRERVLLAGWGRAILLQIAHPMVAQGVADHSAFTTEPWGWLRRLDRTLRSMLALTFGSDAQAAAAAARINALNESSSIASPSRMSIARRVLPSRLALKRPEGSSSEAPLAKVIFTTFL